jgi:hypothetical protein
MLKRKFGCEQATWRCEQDLQKNGANVVWAHSGLKHKFTTILFASVNKFGTNWSYSCLVTPKMLKRSY